MEKKKEKNYRLSLVISILIAACLFVADLYIMINMPQNVLALVAVNVLFLAAIYYVIDAVTRQISAAAERKEEQYDSIFKSEKASYLLLRKTFDDLYELIEKGNQSRKANVEDIIHAQKAVAKVSIGRSKENADALMNSNDHIMEKISMLEAVLSDNVSHPAPETNKNDSAYAQNILDNQNKILQQLEVLQNTLNTIGADAKIAAESAKQNFFTEERILAEENKIEKEEPSLMEETPVEEEPSVMEETPIEEVPSDMEETSIGKEEVSSPEEDLSKYDDIMVDTLTDSDDNVPVEKIPLEDETVVDDEPAMPDLSDPNKVMTPDEIAALIANL